MMAGLLMDTCSIAPPFGQPVSWVSLAVPVTPSAEGCRGQSLSVQLTAVENSSNEPLLRPRAIMAAYQFPLHAE